MCVRRISMIKKGILGATRYHRGAHRHASIDITDVLTLKLIRFSRNVLINVTIMLFSRSVGRRNIDLSNFVSHVACQAD